MFGGLGVRIDQPNVIVEAECESNSKGATIKLVN